MKLLILNAAFFLLLYVVNFIKTHKWVQNGYDYVLVDDWEGYDVVSWWTVFKANFIPVFITVSMMALVAVALIAGIQADLQHDSEQEIIAVESYENMTEDELISIIIGEEQTWTSEADADIWNS